MFECSQHLSRNIALPTPFLFGKKRHKHFANPPSHATGTNLGNNRVMFERGVGRDRFAHLVPAPW